MSNPTTRTLVTELAELVPARARTTVYALAIVVALLAGAALWAGGIWWPTLDERIDQTAAGVLAGALLVVSVLATAYRPTRAGQTLPPAVELSALDEAYVQEVRARTIDTLVHAGWSPERAAEAVKAGALLTGKASD